MEFLLKIIREGFVEHGPFMGTVLVIGIGAFFYLRFIHIPRVKDMAEKAAISAKQAHQKASEIKKTDVEQDKQLVTITNEIKHINDNMSDLKKGQSDLNQKMDRVIIELVKRNGGGK